MKEPTLHDVLDVLGRIETTQGQHSQALTELSGELKGVRCTLAEHSTVLAEHSTVLAEHSTVLAEHSTVLAEHSTALAEHSVRLADHSRAFDRIERRQRAETSRLDDHEGRLKKLERTRRRAT